MMSENNTNIIFTGSIGAGTKTAIGSITDVVSGKIEFNSSNTAIAHGILQLNDRKKIHLYGTLEEKEQLDFNMNSLNSDCVGLVLLIDNAVENPIQDLAYILKRFSKFISETNIVIGVTQMNLAKKVTLEDYRDELKLRLLNPPLFEVDIRQKKDISFLVQALISNS